MLGVSGSLVGVLSACPEWSTPVDITPLIGLARIRRVVFARHAHPWSGWTRWATAPLVLVPVRTRRCGHPALVAAWFAINPVVFPEPDGGGAWSTRAMLGGGLCLVDRPRDAGWGVNIAAVAAGLAAVVAARRHRVVPAVVAAAAQMALLFVYWELMVRVFDRRTQEETASGERAR